MANIKKLTEYLNGTCELMSDLNHCEKKEMLKIYQDIMPGIKMSDFETDFLDHVLDEAAGKVTYRYWCGVCDMIHEQVLNIETDFVYIGNCPTEEDDSFDSYTTSQMCRALTTQLINTFGNPPQGAKLMTRYEHGEDGYEVVCEFNTRYPMSLAYAYMLESELPKRWSASAIAVLEKLTGRSHRR